MHHRRPEGPAAGPRLPFIDDLWATVLAVCRKNTPVAAFVSLDLGVITRSPCDEVRTIVAESTGVEFERIALHCTHTHAGYAGCSVDPGYLSGPT